MNINIEGYDAHFKISNDVVKSAEGLSHAEIAKVCNDAIKNSILSDVRITDKTVIDLLNERHDVYSSKEA